MIFMSFFKMWHLPYKLNNKFQYHKNGIFDSINNFFKDNSQNYPLNFHPFFEKWKLKWIMLFNKKHEKWWKLKDFPKYKLFSRTWKLLFEDKWKIKFPKDLQNKYWFFYEVLAKRSQKSLTNKDYLSLENIFNILTNQYIAFNISRDIFFNFCHLYPNRVFDFYKIYVVLLTLNNMWYGENTYIIPYWEYWDDFMWFIFEEDRVLWIPNLNHIFISRLYEQYLKALFNFYGVSSDNKDSYLNLRQYTTKNVSDIIKEKTNLNWIWEILKQEKDFYITLPFIELTNKQYLILINKIFLDDPDIIIYGLPLLLKNDLNTKSKEAWLWFINLKVSWTPQNKFDTCIIKTINIDDIIDDITNIQNNYVDTGDTIRSQIDDTCRCLLYKCQLHNVVNSPKYILSEQEDEYIYKTSNMFNVAWLAYEKVKRTWFYERSLDELDETVSSYILVSYTDRKTLQWQQYFVNFKTIQQIQSLKELIPYLKYPIFEHIFMTYDKNKEIKWKNIDVKICNTLDHCYFCFTDEGLKVFKLSISIADIAHLFDINTRNYHFPSYMFFFLTNWLNLKQKLILWKWIIHTFGSYLLYDMNSSKKINSKNLIPYLSTVVPSWYCPRIDGHPINWIHSQSIDFDPNWYMIYINLFKDKLFWITTDDYRGITQISNNKDLTLWWSFIHNPNIQEFIDAHKQLLLHWKINRTNIDNMKRNIIINKNDKQSNKDYIISYLRPSPYLSWMFKENILVNTISINDHDNITYKNMEAHINRKWKIANIYDIVDDS